jgi:hypothetical protein
MHRGPSDLVEGSGLESVLVETPKGQDTFRGREAGHCALRNKYFTELKHSLRVSEHSSTLWDVITFVHIVLSRSVRQRCENALSGQRDNAERNGPIGATGYMRKSSFTNAFKYGSDPRSAPVGKRVRPITVSISCCASFWTAGNTVMAKKKDSTPATL